MNNLPIEVAEICISYKPAISNKPIIASSLDAFVVIKEFFPTSTISLQERFIVMYLNRANRCLGIFPTSVGGITGTVADPRLILGIALKIAATGIILAHNHPSGTLKPSQSDIELTSKIKEAGKLLEIKLLDHLIITVSETEYYSFADEGMI